MKIGIRARDGLARGGTLAHDDLRLPSPGVAETTTLFPSLLLRAHENVPLPAGEAFVRAWLVPGGEPHAVHPASKEPVPAGAALLVANWHTALADPAAYVRYLVALKEQAPSGRPMVRARRRSAIERSTPYLDRVRPLRLYWARPRDGAGSLPPDRGGVPRRRTRKRALLMPRVRRGRPCPPQQGRPRPRARTRPSLRPRRPAPGSGRRPLPPRRELCRRPAPARPAVCVRRALDPCDGPRAHARELRRGARPARGTPLCRTGARAVSAGPHGYDRPPALLGPKALLPLPQPRPLHQRDPQSGA